MMKTIYAAIKVPENFEPDELYFGMTSKASPNKVKMFTEARIIDQPATEAVAVAVVCEETSHHWGGSSKTGRLHISPIKGMEESGLRAGDRLALLASTDSAGEKRNDYIF